jgi:hypothetical protein
MVGHKSDIKLILGLPQSSHAKLFSLSVPSGACATGSLCLFGAQLVVLSARLSANVKMLMKPTQPGSKS